MKLSPYNRPDYVELYQRLGGADTVRRLGREFSAALRSDPRLDAYFTDVDGEHLATQHESFFVMIFGGPHHYGGLDLRRAHERPRKRGLSNAQIEIAITHFRSVLQRNGIATALADEAESYLQSMRDDILGVA